MWNNGNTGAGPYFGKADYRAAGDANANTTIDGNEIRHVYYAFTYLYYSKFPIVTNNDIHTIRSGVSSIIGISINLGSRVICSGNYIHDLKASTNQSMIINQSPGNSTLKTLIENNEIYAFTGTSNYGPQVNSSSYVEYNNNSIHDLTSSGYNY
jgi:hypothetical protein